MYNRSNSIYLVILLAKGQIICKMDLLILIQFNTMYCTCQPAKKQEAIIFRCICAPHNIALIQLYVDFYQNMISLMKVKSIVMTLATPWKVTQDSRVHYKSICYKKICSEINLEFIRYGYIQARYTAGCYFVDHIYHVDKVLRDMQI